MSATLLPNAEQQFVDGNGKPLAGGSVYFYIPNTSTPKSTWQDSAQTILNTNPVILDGAGRAIIWGAGVYRQVVYDQFNNLVWDQITEDTSGGLLGNITDNLFHAGTDFTPGTTTQLTLTVGPGSLSNMWVFFDGVYQTDDGLSLSGTTTLVFSSPIPVGVQEVTVKIGNSVSIGVPSSGTVTDSSVSSASKLYNRIYDIPSVRDYGAKCDGATDDTAAFQKAVNSVPAGQVRQILVPATSLINGTVTAGAGTVGWNFAQGAVLNGSGTIPFQADAMTYNSTPNYGKRLSIWNGTDANPCLDGTVPTNYIQRVDKSVTADDPGHLLYGQYITFKRLAGGTGWLYGSYAYVEDNSTTGAAQSVGMAGVIHGVTSGAVWGAYSEAHSHNSSVTVTAAEFDAYNNSSSDYPYNYTFPTTTPFSCGVWVPSFGKRNSFAIGIGAGNTPNSTTASWQTGIYMQTWSAIQYGIDIQAQPSTLINFKYGASTDGTGTTAGGIGLDVGTKAVAGYGTAANQCAIHLRDQRLGFGSFAFMQYNASSNYLEIWSSVSTRAAHLDLATGLWSAG